MAVGSEVVGAAGGASPLASPAAPIARRVPQRGRRRRRSPALVLLLPSLVVLGLVNIYPLVYAALESVHRGNLVETGRYVGGANYAEILHDAQFWNAAKFTLVFTLAAVFGSYVVGGALALLLRAGVPGASFFRVLLLLPWICPQVVSITSWNFLVGTPSSYVIGLSKDLGLGSPLFLADPTLAMVTVCVVKVWESFPFMMLVLGAGLEGIEPGLYEAASIDGASWYRQTRYITLPLMKRVTYMSWVLMAIYSINDFSTIWLLTAGGPLNATTNLMTYSYELVFQNFETGYGVSVALVTAALMVVVSVYLYRLVTRSYATTRAGG